MEHTLKNGKTVVIRKPTPEDAEAIINIIATADTETRFLAREPGELSFTVEQERELITATLKDENSEWFVAEYDGELVAECSVGLIRTVRRFRHRAGVAFVVLKDYCGMGIGGKLMQECINWCREKGLEQIELEVVAENERALNMYKGFGFEIVGTKPKALKYADGTYADEYVMVKFL